MRCVCVIVRRWSRFLSNRFRPVDHDWTPSKIHTIQHIRCTSGKERNAINRMYLWHVWIKERISTWRKEGEHVYREEIADGIKIKCDFLVYIRMYSIMFALKGNGDETLWFVKMTCVCGGCRRRTRLHEGVRSRAAGNREWHFAGVMAISGRTRGCAAFIRHSSRIVYCRWAIHIAIYVGISIQIL